MPQDADLPRPFCVLAGVDPRARGVMLLLDHGRVDFELFDGTRGWAFGIPWGKGDPEAAGLQSARWAVVRIGADDICVWKSDPQTGVVAFSSGTVIYRGDPRGALECLLHQGADPESMSVRLILPERGGVADGGDYSVAVAGEQGIARVGVFGTAIAGAGGVVIAGPRGRASVPEWGIAIADEAATAEIAGTESLAVARGRNASADAGAGLGAAVALERADRLAAGAGGKVIAPWGAKEVHVGPGGVAVIGGYAWDKVFVRAGRGALVIYRPDFQDCRFDRMLVAVAGEEGFAADTTYVAVEGELLSTDEWYDRQGETDEANEDGSAPAATDEREIGERQPGPADRTMPARETRWWEVAKACDPYAEALAIELAAGETMVLVSGGLGESLGDISAETFGPDAERADGFVGLAWGKGDIAILNGTFESHLVIVKDPVTVPTDGGGHVKFGRGKVAYRGGLAGALKALECLGVDPRDMALPLVAAEADGIALLRRQVWMVDDERGWTRAGGRGCAFYGDLAEAGDEGIAKTDARAAIAGHLGVAIADEGGRAVAGTRGIAVSGGKRHGVAAAGAYGVAFAEGKYKLISTGDYGVAIDLGDYSNNIVEGGAFAVVVAGGRVEGAYGSIVVQTSLGYDGKVTIQGSSSSLLVAHDGRRWIHGIVGEDGLKADHPYVARDGAFRSSHEHGSG